MARWRDRCSGHHTGTLSSQLMTTRICAGLTYFLLLILPVAAQDQEPYFEFEFGTETEWDKGLIGQESQSIKWINVNTNKDTGPKMRRG